MKIDTKENEWQPIVVTIQTRKEAKELCEDLGNGFTGAGFQLYDFLNKYLEEDTP